MIGRWWRVLLVLGALVNIVAGFVVMTTALPSGAWWATVIRIALTVWILVCVVFACHRPESPQHPEDRT
jgi:O-antigen/teichoic acid export membrane protein